MGAALFSTDQFAELRRQAAGATNLACFWDYFFTEFVERPGFMKVGQETTVPGITDVLAMVAGYTLGTEPVRPGGLLLLEIPGGIIHGSCVFDGRVAALVYVPAIDLGMLAIMGPGGVMTYCRFVLQSETEGRAAVC